MVAGHAGYEVAGAWLRESRVAAGLTQEGLAARSGVSVRTISDIERGVSARPYPRSIRLLAEALALPQALSDEVVARFRRGGASAGRWPSGAEGDGNGLQGWGEVGGGRWPVPCSLPAGLPHFTGRAGELAALTRMLDDLCGPNGTVVISTISGTAGVGKTALAIHWAHQVAAGFPDGQLYAGLRGFDEARTPVASEEVLGEFLVALGVPARQVPPGLAGRSALYRSLVAGRRMLIVLDNARDERQARPLLPGSPGCLVIVTSRNHLAGLAASDGAQLLPLGLLPDAEARQLLTARVGSDRAAAEPEAVTQIVGLCARLPLALAITAARAAASPHLPLACLAADLADVRYRLDALDAGDSAASARAAFCCSYQNLTEPAKQMFCLLSQHPGPDISARAAASLAGTSLHEAWRRLTELVRANLTMQHVAGRYALHDLLRAYATEQARAASGEEARQAAVGRVLDHYLHTALAAALLLAPWRKAVTLAPVRPGVTPERLNSLQDALDWFEAEHQVLVAVATLADKARSDACAWQIPWAMTDFLDWRGHWHDWAVTQRIALAAASRLADPVAQAAAQLILGTTSAKFGDYDQARDELTGCLGLYRQLGDQAGEARTHQVLMWVAERQSRYSDALRHAEQALALYQATLNVAGQADALNDIGWCCALLGDYKQARAFCLQALVLNCKIGDRRNEAHTWDSLGYVEHQFGRHSTAAACYQHALRLSRELGGDLFFEADVLTHLGDIHNAAGDTQQARNTWQHALDILDNLHHPDADQIRAKTSSAGLLQASSQKDEILHTWRLQSSEGLSVPDGSIAGTALSLFRS